MNTNMFSGSRRDVVEAILESVSREPEAWDVDNYKATHTASGIFVWIANGLTGLSVGRGSVLGGELFGGVTFASVFFSSLIPWRRKLYDAFTELGRKRRATDSAMLISALRTAA